MLNIEIICVGKIKEASIRELSNEYSKRISKYAKLTLTEVLDESLANVSSNKEIQKVKDIEGNRIIERINKISKPYIICLNLDGKNLTSEEFANNLQNITIKGFSNIVFVIGGSYGISQDVLNLSNEKISFSKLTFPHMLFRVMLLEQIYRAFKITNNETYHK